MGSLPVLKKKLQGEFNKYIRKRDGGEDEMGICISCGKFRKLQAGHFYPVKGYDSLRFDEDNVHGECAGCNGFDKGHLIGYQINLRKKIGDKKVDDLISRAEESKRTTHKFYRHDLEEKIQYYKNLNKL